MARKKPGKRYKSGDRKITDEERLKTAEETAWETKLPVLEKRCTLLGWRPTIENLRKVDKYGTAWGLYYLGGLLDRRRFEAADQFAVMRREYVLARGLPIETAPCASWDAPTAPSPPADPSRAALIKVAMYDDLSASLGKLHEVVVIDFVIGEGFRDAALLFDALDAVADVLKLPVYGEEENAA